LIELNFLVVENSDLIADQSSDKLFDPSDKIFVELVFLLDDEWVDFCALKFVSFFNDFLQGINRVFSVIINIISLQATQSKQEVEKINFKR
jgi:hypothetical protein